jgi:hypothetical protein
MIKLTRLFVLSLVLSWSGIVLAAGDFSGTWVLNTQKGENLGMVAAVDQTLVMTQSDTQLILDYTNEFMGTHKRKVTLDLGGAEVENPAAMGDPSLTESGWDGDNLVTTWTTERALGDPLKSIVTIELAADGTMTISTERANKPTTILVYEKQ